MDRRHTMKYTKEQRLDIGRRIYDGEMTKYQAAEQYEISDQTARDYMRLYRHENDLPPKYGHHAANGSMTVPKTLPETQNLETYESMSKEGRWCRCRSLYGLSPSLASATLYHRY